MAQHIVVSISSCVKNLKAIAEDCSQFRVATTTITIGYVVYRQANVMKVGLSANVDPSHYHIHKQHTPRGSHPQIHTLLQVVHGPLPNVDVLINTCAVAFIVTVALQHTGMLLHFSTSDCSEACSQSRHYQLAMDYSSHSRLKEIWCFQCWEHGKHCIINHSPPPPNHACCE